MARRPKPKKTSGSRAQRDTSSYVDRNSAASDALSALKRLETHVNSYGPSITTPLDNGAKKVNSSNSGEVGLTERTGSGERAFEGEFGDKIDNIHQKIDYERKLSEQTLDAKLSQLETRLNEKIGSTRDSVKTWGIGFAIGLVGIVLGNIYWSETSKDKLNDKINNVLQTIRTTGQPSEKPIDEEKVKQLIQQHQVKNVQTES